MGFQPVMITQSDFGAIEYPEEVDLERYLHEKGVEIRKGGTCDLVENNLEHDEFIALIADAPMLSREFMNGYLSLVHADSKPLLMQERAFANVRIPLSLLETVIGGLSQQEIEKEIEKCANGALEYIDCFYHNHTFADPARDDGKLVMRTTKANSTFGFTYDEEMHGIARATVNGSDSIYERSQKVSMWVRENITYDFIEAKEERSKTDLFPRGSLETFRDRRAVCLGMAMLQVTMERLVGNDSFLAVCGFDEYLESNLGEHPSIQREPVSEYNIRVKKAHAFVATVLDTGKILFSDPTNMMFDFNPRSYQILSNREVLCNYNRSDYGN